MSHTYTVEFALSAEHKVNTRIIKCDTDAQITEILLANVKAKFQRGGWVSATLQKTYELAHSIDLIVRKDNSGKVFSFEDETMKSDREIDAIIGWENLQPRAVA